MPTTPKKKNRRPLLTASIIVIALSALLFFAYNRWMASSPAIKNAQQYELQQEKTEAEHKEPEKTIIHTKEAPPEPAPEDQTEKIVNRQPSECEEVSDRLSDFITHLSNQEYIKAYAIKEDLADYLNTIVVRLLNNPPAISEESDDILSILKNAAHFYRVLGPKDVSLLKDILVYENEGIENVLAELYRWSEISDNCSSSQIQFSLPIKKTYEYSCFFLNTLGGQSYLFRRESRTRTLIRYYSLLILDSADKNGLNKYGLNPIEILEPAIDELKEAHYLIDKDIYLKTLSAIHERSRKDFTREDLN